MTFFFTQNFSFIVGVNDHAEIFRRGVAQDSLRTFQFKVQGVFRRFELSLEEEKGTGHMCN